mmetsp:Transcript_54618/g.175158  ORF Transcript_54618/g.175158 Transcript_54618/m.175158 type:complete len:217 (+) Transcript_54618:465-1115(+)
MTFSSCPALSSERYLGIEIRLSPKSKTASCSAGFRRMALPPWLLRQRPSRESASTGAFRMPSAVSRAKSSGWPSITSFSISSLVRWEPAGSSSSRSTFLSTWRMGDEAPQVKRPASDMRCHWLTRWRRRPQASCVAFSSRFRLSVLRTSAGILCFLGSDSWECPCVATTSSKTTRSEPTPQLSLYAVSATCFAVAWSACASRRPRCAALPARRFSR